MRSSARGSETTIADVEPAMKVVEFKKGVEKAFRAAGFERTGKLYRREGADVIMMIGFQKGVGGQWFERTR